MVNYVGISPTPISIPPWIQDSSQDIAVAADKSLVVDGYDSTDVDIMADMILQDIGAVELSMITRYDSLDGVKMVYSPIAARTRMVLYSANNLLGQPYSTLHSNGIDVLNSAHYVDGELNRGYQLSNEPPSLDMNIQVASTADIVPFSTSGEVYEVV